MLLTQRIKSTITEPGFLKYLKNTGWVFFGRIFNIGLSFIVTVYTARQLGVETYGMLNYILSLVGIVGISIFTIDSLIMKMLNSGEENREEVLGTSLVIKTINALVAVCISTIVAYSLSSSTNAIAFLVLAYSTFTIFQVFNSIDIYFKSKSDIKKLIIIYIATSFITALVRIAVLYFGLGLLALLLTYVFDAIIGMIGNIYLYTKEVGRITSWRFSKNVFKKLTLGSWTFTASAFATAVYYTIDQIYLKHLIGNESVGIYVVAVRFSEVWFVISSVLCTVLLPAILNARRTDYALFIERSKRLYALLFYIAVAICVSIYVIAPILVDVVYGEAYMESVGLLRIYIWSIIGIYINTALQQMLLADGKFRSILLLNIFAMLISIILHPIGITYLGASGAAIVNVFAYSLPVVMLLSMKGMADQRKSLLSGIMRPIGAIR